MDVWGCVFLKLQMWWYPDEGRRCWRLQQHRQQMWLQEKQGAAASSLLICLQWVKQSQRKTTADFSSFFIATPRMEGAQHTRWGANWYRQRNRGYRIPACIQVTSFMPRAMQKRPGMKFWGDFKACWNHPEPVVSQILSQMRIQSNCQQLKQKVKWRASKALPDTKGKNPQNTPLLLTHNNTFPFFTILIWFVTFLLTLSEPCHDYVYYVITEYLCSISLLI